MSHMNNTQIRIAFKVAVEGDNAIPKKVKTLCGQLGITKHHLKLMCKEKGYVTFKQLGVLYITTKRGFTRYNNTVHAA